jgi:hypothetical protein
MRSVFLVVCFVCLFFGVATAEEKEPDWVQELESALTITHTVDREIALRRIVDEAPEDLAKTARVWLDELLVLIGKKF